MHTVVHLQFFIENKFFLWQFIAYRNVIYVAIAQNTN